MKKVKVTILCDGVKKGDRKIKTQRLEEGYLDVEKIDDVKEEDIEKAKENARAFIKNYKKASNLRIKLQPVELKEDQFGTIESYIMFTDKIINIH